MSTSTTSASTATSAVLKSDFCKYGDGKMYRFQCNLFFRFLVQFSLSGLVGVAPPFPLPPPLAGGAPLGPAGFPAALPAPFGAGALPLAGGSAFFSSIAAVSLAAGGTVGLYKALPLPLPFIIVMCASLLVIVAVGISPASPALLPRGRSMSLLPLPSAGAVASLGPLLLGPSPPGCNTDLLSAPVTVITGTESVLAPPGQRAALLSAPLTVIIGTAPPSPKSAPSADGVSIFATTVCLSIQSASVKSFKRACKLCVLRMPECSQTSWPNFVSSSTSQAFSSNTRQKKVRMAWLDLKEATSS
mmetsp:Transcript_27612/g.63829  ORF Transcript_27612/g.63829 Transcript_27612/m.63829 type:complete len:302 (-) Transcript_27612:965-1870(-)